MAHEHSPSELQAVLRAERQGSPFLVVRDGEGTQQLVGLVAERLTVGRSEGNGLALGWDEEVSRLHAELECVAGVWTVIDDGLSRNGTFLNGQRISGRQRLADGDVLRLGRTSLAFRNPAKEETRERTVVAGDVPDPGELTPTQRQVLTALARPLQHGAQATPATNQEVAGEVHLSVDAVKAHLRALYARFGIEDLAQNEKRARLAADALSLGLVPRG